MVYVSPHGTGSLAGEETDPTALQACGLTGVFLSPIKSLIGHNSSVAWTVAVMATLLPMQSGDLRDLGTVVPASIAGRRRHAEANP